MSRPWMPLYIADYRADTAHLSAAEHGAYLLLIMHYWATGGLPTGDAPLARIACMSPLEWRRCKETIACFFSEGWRHKRIDEELARAADISTKRSASAKLRHSNSSANAEQVDTHARGLPQPQSQSQAKEKKETRASALASGWPPDFREQFWSAYPNKVGKADAIRKLEKVEKSRQIGFDELMAALFRYANKLDDRPFCNPGTWLHQERWTDQPAPNNGVKNEKVSINRDLIEAGNALVARTRERLAEFGEEAELCEREGGSLAWSIPEG